jgi:trimeric autotransporter adhesin
MIKHLFLHLAAALFIVAALNLHPVIAQVGNTKYGSFALNSNTTGDYNSAFGYAALYSNTTGTPNTAIGYTALYTNTSGYENTAIGAYALRNNTSGHENTATGAYALRSNTTGSFNTANGLYTLRYNTTGSYNTATGAFALYASTTGKDNTAIGYVSLATNTTGSKNTATGTSTLSANTTGYENTANGHSTLRSNTTGSNNTATGFSALLENTTGSNNTANGSKALRSNTTGSRNTVHGAQALYANTTGTNNTAIGFNALFPNITGIANTGIGYSAGPSSSGLSNTTALGYLATPTASNQVRIGNTAITSIGGQVGWSTFSDGRYKQNIKQDVQGLAFINSLSPVTYTVDTKGLNAYYNKGRIKMKETEDEEMSQHEIKAEEQAGKVVYNGFIAQEVEEAAKKLNYVFSGVDKPESEDGLYGLRYSDFVVPLVKAVQELDAENKKLAEENKQVKQELAELRQMVLELKKGNSNEGSNTFKAYLEGSTPNPVGDAALIRYYIPQSSGTAHIVITDIKGANIKSITLSNKGAGQLSVNTTTWTAGIYTYTLYINGAQADSKKLVIAR